ncbi:MAG: hypothetical protein V5A68_03835 [Candidatus Thermoplasmatota archaeon]
MENEKVKQKIQEILLFLGNRVNNLSITVVSHFEGTIQYLFLRLKEICNEDLTKEDFVKKMNEETRTFKNFVENNSFEELSDENSGIYIGLNFFEGKMKDADDINEFLDDFEKYLFAFQKCRVYYHQKRLENPNFSLEKCIIDLLEV